MPLDVSVLQKAIHDAGFPWIARVPPPTEQHGLGRLAPEPQKAEAARQVAHRMLQSRIQLVPPDRPNLAPERDPLLPGASTAVTVAAAAASLPAEMDWRTRGIIGPALDQGWCGSC